jgi:hypothetical protein
MLEYAYEVDGGPRLPFYDMWFEILMYAFTRVKRWTAVEVLERVSTTRPGSSAIEQSDESTAAPKTAVLALDHDGRRSVVGV